MTSLSPQSPQDTLKLLYEVSREFNSALDLRTVLQRVLFLTMKNIGAKSGSIIVVNEEGEPIESAIIYGGNVHSQTTQQLRATTERGLAGWVLRNRVAALVQDTSKDPRWLRRPDDAEERTGSKSAISAPLISRKHLVGVLTLVHQEPNHFSEIHFNLVKAIADQASVAVLNARLYAESQRQARVMAALAETASVINATLDTREVLQRITAQAQKALDVEAVSLGLIDHAAGEIVFRASVGGAGPQIIGSRLKIGQGIVGWVAQTGEALIIPRAHEDPRFDPETDRRTGFYTQAIACAPIVQESAIIGVLEAINPRGHRFGSETLTVLSGICNLAGSAINHAQLFARLQAAHQRYRDLFEDSISPIVITDLEGNILEVNRRTVEASEYTRETLRRKNITDLHEIDARYGGASLTALRTASHTITYESVMRTRSGAEIPIQVLARRVTIEGREHIQWILRDISERKNIDQLRNDLISMIYHDLRSPLANIISSLDVLRSMLPENDAAIESVMQIAVRSTERIQRLTNSLLDVHRLESGKAVVSQEIIGLAALAQDAVDAVRLVAEAKQHTVEVNLPDDLPALFVDSDMIRRVLINLMENAVKYTPNNGHICLEARALDGWVEVSVVDSGPGIPESEQELIFHKFTRLGNRESAKGLGLGLTFCRLAVQAHGGRIWVKSKEGVGSRFSLTLPAAPPETQINAMHSRRQNLG